MHRIARCVSGLAVAAIAVAACGGDDDAVTTTAAAAPAPASVETLVAAETTAAAAAVNTTPSNTDPDPNAIVATAESALGTVVADKDGFTLYGFDADEVGRPASTCYDQCATNWPPLLADGTAVAAGSIDASKLGVVQRTDETWQVTYNNWPLYHFSGDTEPGQLSGQNVGGTWHVLDAAGVLVTTAAPAAATPTETTAAAAAAPALLQVGESSLGHIITDGAGLSLYFFDNDQPVLPQSTCNGECAATWPPYLAPGGGELTVGEGLDATLLSTTTRDDGSIQLTYNNWPLYYFGGDAASGDINGQEIGDVWHVVGTDGKPLRTG